MIVAIGFILLLVGCGYLMSCGESTEAYQWGVAIAYFLVGAIIITESIANQN